MPKIKLKDIARICGVDISTVSRGMRGDPRVKPETRQEIEETALRLGYRPNLVARNLAGGKTRTLWLILPSIDASIDHRLVRNASHAAIKQGYTLFAALHDCDNFGDQSRNDIANYERVIHMAAQGTTDGVVIIPRRGADDFALLQELIRHEFPLVFLDNYSETLLQNPIVTTDNEAAARDLTQQCIEAGASGAILLFDEPNPVARARQAGAMSALLANRLPFVSQAQWESDPESAAATLGATVAIIGSSQTGHIQPLVNRHASRFSSARLFFGVFDQWTGEPTPAQKVFVAVQDGEALANEAIKLLIELVEKRPTSGKRLSRIPIQGITELQPNFALT